jgi:precorrin-6y C5,15-methyltransferase (decarboxylating) CbiE subunit
MSITPEARSAALRADVLIGARRLLDLFPESTARIIAVRGEIDVAITAIASNRRRRVALLVTGDPGVSSLARPVLKHFGRGACQVVPGVSSVQVAFARLGVDWTDARIVSAHGVAPESEFHVLAKENKIAILAGSARAANWAADLADHLGAGWRFFAAEHLTLENERVYETSSDALRSGALPALSVLLFLRGDCI